MNGLSAIEKEIDGPTVVFARRGRFIIWLWNTPLPESLIGIVSLACHMGLKILGNFGISYTA